MTARPMKKVPPNLLSWTEHDHLPPARGLRVEVLTNSKGYMELNLNKRDLRMIPPETFQLSGVQVLRLTHNHIDYLPMMIAYLRGLRLLDLQHNLLVHLPETLVNCRHLAELQLTANRLTELPKSIGGLRNLRVLALGENQFEQLPQEVGQLTSLRTLDLHGNKLWHLPFSLQELKHLLQLNISDNMFDHVPLVITKITSLQALNLSKNRLATLPLDFDHLKSLRELNMSHNKFVSVSSMLVTLKHLKYLSLASNGLKFLPSQMSHLQNLRVLHLQDNCLRHVPSLLRRLRYYNVSKNQLTSFSAEGMRNLVSLTASCNKLETTPRGLHKLKQLKFLYLDDNHLVELEEDLGLLRQLRVLDLSNNDLICLPESLYRLPILQSFNVRGNYKLTKTGMGKAGRDKHRVDHAQYKLKQQKLRDKLTKATSDPGGHSAMVGSEAKAIRNGQIMMNTTGEMDFDKEDEGLDKSLPHQASDNGRRKPTVKMNGYIPPFQTGSMRGPRAGSEWELRSPKSEATQTTNQKLFKGRSVTLPSKKATMNLQKKTVGTPSPSSVKQEKVKPRKFHSVKSFRDFLFGKSKKAKSIRSDTEVWDPHATMRTANSLQFPMHYSMEEVDMGRPGRRHSDATSYSVTTKDSARPSYGKTMKTDIDEISNTFTNRSYKSSQNRKTAGDLRSESHGYGTWRSRASTFYDHDHHGERSYHKRHFEELDNHLLPASPGKRKNLSDRYRSMRERSMGKSVSSDATTSDIVYIPYYRSGRRVSGQWYRPDDGKSMTRNGTSTINPDYSIQEAQASFVTETTSRAGPFYHRSRPSSSHSYKREARSLPASALASHDHSVREAYASFATETTSDDHMYTNEMRHRATSYQPYFQEYNNNRHQTSPHPARSEHHLRAPNNEEVWSRYSLRSYKSDPMLNSGQQGHRAQGIHKHDKHQTIPKSLYTSRERLFDSSDSEDNENEFHNYNQSRQADNRSRQFSDWTHGDNRSLQSVEEPWHHSHQQSRTTLPRSATRPHSSRASYISDFVDYDDPPQNQFNVDTFQPSNEAESRPQQSFSQFDHVLSTENLPVNKPKQSRSWTNVEHAYDKDEYSTSKTFDDNFIMKKKPSAPLLRSRSIDSLMDQSSAYVSSPPQSNPQQQPLGTSQYPTPASLHPKSGADNAVVQAKGGNPTGRTDYSLLGVCNQIETLLNKNLLQPVIGFSDNGSHRFSDKTIQEKAKGLWRMGSSAERLNNKDNDLDSDNSDTDDDGDPGFALEYSEPQTFTVNSVGGQFVSSVSPPLMINVPAHAVSKPLHVTIQMLLMSPELIWKVREYNHFVDNIVAVGPVVYFHTTSEITFNSPATITIPAPASIKGGHLVILTIRKDNSCIPCSTAFRSGKLAITLNAWHFSAKVALITRAKCKYKACKSMEQLLLCVGATQI